MTAAPNNHTGGLKELSFEDTSIELATKPGVSLHYTLNESSSEYLLVCINGLLVPQAGWFPTLFELTKCCQRQSISCPSILTYDRWLQGRTTDCDPLDSAPDREPGYGHTVKDVVTDLHQLLLQITQAHSTAHLPPLIFLANSIGCPISRLYAATHPGSIHAFIFLDSMMANTDFVSLWPDPDSPSFDPAASLPDGTSAAEVRSAREHYSRLFHPSATNAENLDRRNLRTLLPHAHFPPLPPVTSTGAAPLLVIVGHDAETFAREGEERLGIPGALTLRYPHAAWCQYNEGLTKLTDCDKAKGPVVAKGCGHFVQRDGPQFVASLVGDVLSALINNTPLR